jgi:hypothetical protein
MTVCIAVGCDCLSDEKAPKIILVADALLSLGYTSTETAYKSRLLEKGWAVMMAGEDITHGSEVRDTASGILKKKTEKTAAVVSDAMATAYQAIRRSQIESRVLKTYDLTMEEFVKDGKAAFPESHHLNLLYEMDRFDLGCEFLVAGFSSETSDVPCFFTVRNPGVTAVFDDIGYCAIGSGEINAISYLARRDQEVHSTFERSLYNAIVAKHLAEKASGVGKLFGVVILENGKEFSVLDDSQTFAISEIWKKEEEKISPPNLESRIAKIVGKS